MTVQNQRAEHAQQRLSRSTNLKRTPASATGSTAAQAAALVDEVTSVMPKTATTSNERPITPTATPSSGGGPRVSFNRDVHIKRIEKRSNEPTTNYETKKQPHSTQPLSQPHQSSSTQHYRQLSAELDPAAIRKEAALVLSQAKRHSSRPANGEAQAAPAFRLKAKHQQFNSLPTRHKAKGAAVAGKPVSRSVSDASNKHPPSTSAKRGSIFGLFARKSSEPPSARDPRFEESGGRRLVRSKSDVERRPTLKKPHKEPPTTATTLSPIIEQTQREDYFAAVAEQEQLGPQPRARRKSDAITLREKQHESALSKENDESADGVQPAQSTQLAMHSSQLPAERPPLTKGRTVNGLVKRLSMERFSPQPVINQPAFSYIRPNEGITYAQLANDEQQQPLRTRSPPARPPRIGRHFDTTDFVPKPAVTSTTTIRIAGNQLSDEDEGLGLETRKHYEPTIIPVTTSSTMTNGYRDQSPLADLGYRRARLESRILTRRFGSSATEQTSTSTPAPAQALTPERNYTPTVAAVQHNSEKTSRYRHTKYYDDGRGGVKEVYERETHTQGDGKPQVRESHHRERLGSSAIDYAPDYEPKSLDSQFTSTDQCRSSPELAARYDLTRDKLQQRSFDKGDSGIENDFRKESFNGEISSRWRKPTAPDPIDACESFLKKERRHTEQLQAPARHKEPYAYRERSIDDGSHYDPNLDKYPVATSALGRRDQHSQTYEADQREAASAGSTLKRAKKLGGFEKVKQLFTGGVAGASSQNSNAKKDNSSTLSRKQSKDAASRDKVKEHRERERERERDLESGYMVKEEEMRSRYREHRANLQNENETSREPKTIVDISTRRRLSTPKASPLLLKRTSSDKSKPKESPLAKPEKLSWFKSLDRRAKNKSKSKEKLNVSVNGKSETSSLKRTKTAIRNGGTDASAAAPAKNLRFFGDTDLDSNPPTISKASNTPRSRPALATNSLNRAHQKYSKSAYQLDRIKPCSTPDDDYRHTLAQPTSGSGVAHTRHKSSSMQNLNKSGADEVDYRRRRHYSRSRELHDISESGSESEQRHHQHHHHHQQHHQHQQQQQTSLNGRVGGAYGARAKSLERSYGGEAQHGTSKHGYPLLGPPKPARSAERRIIRENERYPTESSGTEGDSSFNSQRSIVYLHATTVGAIPQPYNLRRRAASRDDLRNGKSTQSQPLQPMTRTVSRSVSMLAPWKPKFASEGYEINYAQEQNKRLPGLPRKPTSSSRYKDDESLTSASKSFLSVKPPSSRSASRIK